MTGLRSPFPRNSRSGTKISFWRPTRSAAINHRLYERDHHEPNLLTGNVGNARARRVNRTGNERIAPVTGVYACRDIATG